MRCAILFFAVYLSFFVYENIALARPSVKALKVVRSAAHNAASYNKSIRKLSHLGPNFGRLKICYIATAQPTSAPKKDSYTAESAELYRNLLAKKLKRQGISTATIDKLFQAKVLERVVSLDKKQTSDTTLNDYVRSVVKRFDLTGSNRIKQNLSLLRSMEDIFAVDKELLVATWGMETAFGSFVGNNRAIDVLFTLALEGRRRTFFESELLTFFRLVDQGTLPWDIVSSYAGAIGQCQFMPSAIVRYAIGYRAEKLSLIQNGKTSLASIANYYSRKGWCLGDPVMTAVTLPDKFDACLIGMVEPKSIKQWLALGVKFAPGGIGKEALRQQDRAAYLVMPEGIHNGFNTSNRTFLFYDNAMAIYQWNVSSQFVVTIAHLMERYKSKKDTA